jgi:hypothetical protein
VRADRASVKLLRRHVGGFVTQHLVKKIAGPRQQKRSDANLAAGR